MEDAPYPPRRGSPLRNWQHVALFAKLGPTHVFSVGQSETDASMPIAASWHHVANGDFPQKRLKLVNRALRVLRPRQYPIDHEQATTKINDQLRQVIQATKPDLFVLANWHDALPDALLGVHPLILDAHNVESKLFSDLAERAGTRRSMKQRYRQWQFERKERSLLTAADKIWVTSEEDRDKLCEMFPLASVSVWPNAIDLKPYETLREWNFSRGRLRDTSSPTLLYTGSFSYAPNASAALVLVDEILPRLLHRHPKARVLLVGKDPTNSMINRALNNPQVEVLGAIPEMTSALMQADVVAVPLLDGGGTRLKIIEAFASGIPVVATAKGAEGLGAIDGVHLAIRDDWEDFALAVSDCLEDATIRETRIKAAYNLVCDRFSWSGLEKTLPSAIAALITPTVGRA